jgi:trehalose/maltose transport system substrate-binding protein
VSCGSVGKEFETCKEGVEAWEKKTGNKVKLVSSPTSSSEKLAVAQQLLGAGASDIDVFSVDVVWPGILGSFFLDLKQYSKGAENEHFPALVANGTLDGKLSPCRGSPDAGCCYRRTLLDKYRSQCPRRGRSSPRPPRRSRTRRGARPATRTCRASCSRARPTRA